MQPPGGQGSSHPLSHFRTSSPHRNHGVVCVCCSKSLSLRGVVTQQQKMNAASPPLNTVQPLQRPVSSTPCRPSRTPTPAPLLAGPSPPALTPVWTALHPHPRNPFPSLGQAPPLATPSSWVARHTAGTVSDWGSLKISSSHSPI